LKSFEDLHGLWFILLKERNLLYTERDYARSKNVFMSNPARMKKVRLSMNRLKNVLGERTREYKKIKSDVEKELNNNAASGEQSAV
jgi:large subunit ribosomal protein L47